MIRNLLRQIWSRICIAYDDLTGRTVNLDGRPVTGADLVAGGYLLTVNLGTPDQPIPTLRVHPGVTLHVNGWRVFATRMILEGDSTVEHP